MQTRTTIMFLLSIFFNLALLVLILISSTVIVNAHPGNTASDGAHYCWTNCDYWGVPYGERHYHGGGYYEPTYYYDYYEDGYEWGSTEGVDNNRDYITEMAEYYGFQHGRSAGLENDSIYGSSSDIPEDVCDIDFDFNPGEEQDYMDGVNEGYRETCYDIAKDVYLDSYSEGHSVGLANYKSATENKSNSSPNTNSTDSSNSSVWLSIIFLVGVFVVLPLIGEYWDDIKKWWNDSNY